jgi:hypothetical protein
MAARESAKEAAIFSINFDISICLCYRLSGKESGKNDCNIGNGAHAPGGIQGPQRPWDRLGGQG